METIAELYHYWLELRDQYRSLIAPDPEMLAQTYEAERLRSRMGSAWNEYYYAKYPERREHPMLDRFHGTRPIGY